MVLFKLMLSEFKVSVTQELSTDFQNHVDQLLADNSSNNRFSDQVTLSEESRERYDNKQSRIKYIEAQDGEKFIGVVIVFKRKIIFQGKEVL